MNLNLSMKEISEITGVTYSTVRKIISKFKSGSYTLNFP